jgi:hypothetical protein
MLHHTEAARSTQVPQKSIGRVCAEHGSRTVQYFCTATDDKFWRRLRNDLWASGILHSLRLALANGTADVVQNATSRICRLAGLVAAG